MDAGRALAWQHVLSQLSPRDVATCERVSRGLAVVARSDFVWESLTGRRNWNLAPLSVNQRRRLERAARTGPPCRFCNGIVCAGICAKSTYYHRLTGVDERLVQARADLAEGSLAPLFSGFDKAKPPKKSTG